jgi:hypothetical protein
MGGATNMKTSAMMRCPKCEETSELDNLHLLDRSFKREWVGLTFQEQQEAILNTHSIHEAIMNVEKRLKEKNGA